MNKLITTIVLLLVTILSYAQATKLAVVSFEANDNAINQSELFEILSIEISKQIKFTTIDKYEVQEVLKNNDIVPESCLSLSCLVKSGKLLSADQILTGSARKLGDRLYITLRLIDVDANLQSETSQEFNYVPQKAGEMVKITTNIMLGLPNDPATLKALTDKETFESAVNNPEDYQLNLGGPRMGYTFLTGNSAKVIRAPKSEGGYNKIPAFFQMGYQFEKQYLNEGKVQALFEFIPMITGLDQGMFVPSFTIMNGLRNNQTGLEIAVGPSVNFSKEIEKFNYNDTWYTYDDLYDLDPSLKSYELDSEYIMDSRGSSRIKSYIVIAAGYSFKSGKLNIPVNAYVVPSKDNLRFGISVGFNTRN